MIKIEKLTKSFGKNEVLKGIDTTIKEGKLLRSLDHLVQENRRSFAASIYLKSRLLVSLRLRTPKSPTQKRMH